ncbi:hypothetical protein [Staphylococcus succinus]|uniref:hypothetical protein n=1 Tax=Staphylococcus succinus TaxID=61015 RepID=UPI000E68B6C1|nr:hypothetical protein [Staphylococcus succinus]RIN27717.1 hypothetical protein BU067_01540 [Staphylococcus succinus]
MLGLAICLLMLMLDPIITSNASNNMAFAAEKKDEEKTQNEQPFDPTKYNTDIKSTVDGNGTTSLKEVEGNENDVWTNYASILMAASEKKQKKEDEKKRKKEENKTIKDRITGAVQAPFNNAINGAMSNGAIVYDEPFSKMSSDSKMIDAGKNVEDPNHKPSGKAGQMVASVIATSSHYNYWDSVSGNAIANGAGGAWTKAVRFISGGIAMIGLICYYLLNKLQDVIADTMIEINPYKLFHFVGGDNVVTNNGIVKGINSFINDIGLSAKLVASIAGLGLLCIVMFYTLRIIMSMRKGNLREGNQLWKNLFTRVIVCVLLISFLSMAATMMGHMLKGLKHDTALGSNAVLSHLYDTKSIASGTNLSPTGGVSTDRPDVGMDKSYIDTKFDPSVSRKRISEANQNANWILYGTPKTTDGKKDLSYTLLERYMDSKRFNVNNYIADLRRTSKQTGTGDYLPGVKTYPEDFKKSNGEKASRKSLELSMWSATQNVDKTVRYPQGKNFKSSGTTGVSPGSSTGVVNDSTFSTQSVVLLLQSSFDGDSAKFNAFNLGAKGEQSAMKSISTVKTEWNAVTLPGNGVPGKFASWLGMISQSITYIIISSAVVITIFTTNLILGYFLFVKQCIRAFVTGSPNSAMATFLLYIGTSVSTVIATYLPDAFNGFLAQISKWLSSALGGFIPASFVEILVALFSMIAAWLIGFKMKFQPNNETLIQMASTILTRIGIAFESRVKQLDEASENVNFKQATQGVFSEAKNKFGEVKNGIVKDTSGVARTYTNKGKESAMGAMQGFYNGTKTGIKTGNPLAAAGSSIVGTGVGAKSGFKNGSSESKTGKEVRSNAKSSVAQSSTMKKVTGNSDKNSANGFDNRKNMKRKARERMANASKDNLNRRKPIGNQLTVPVDNPKGEFSYAERKLRTFKSSQAASYAYDKEGNPYFTQNDIRHIQDSEDLGEYTQNLKETSSGNEYALDTESARVMLEDTQFVDENGNVDVDKVNRFEEELNRKSESGEVTDEDMQQKSIIDSAFVGGAKEKFVQANDDVNEVEGNYTAPSGSETTVNSSAIPPRNQSYSMPSYKGKGNIETPRTETPNTQETMKPRTETPSTQETMKPRTETPSAQETMKPRTETPNTQEQPKPRTETPSVQKQPKPRTETPSTQGTAEPRTETPSTQGTPKPRTETPSTQGTQNKQETTKHRSDLKGMAKDDLKNDVKNTAISTGVGAVTGIDSQTINAGLEAKDAAKDLSEQSKELKNSNDDFNASSSPKPKKRY